MNLTEITLNNNSPEVIAQITDSHLFSSVEGLHHGYNVFENLKNVLLSIHRNPAVTLIVFTGDLTQDHSEQSYQNFVDCVHECHITIPIYYVAGNHDDPKLLTKYLSKAPFISAKEINLPFWQIQLLKSKSETPSGYVDESTLNYLQNNMKQNLPQLVMMHHHPIDVGYFIDQHGLKNKNDFWQAINNCRNIKGIACGHVHGDIMLTKACSNYENPITLYTCPATSIQFDPNVQGVAPLIKGPGYRLFYLYENGQLTSKVIFL